MLCVVARTSAHGAAGARRQRARRSAAAAPHGGRRAPAKELRAVLEYAEMLRQKHQRAVLPAWEPSTWVRKPIAELAVLACHLGVNHKWAWAGLGLEGEMAKNLALKDKSAKERQRDPCPYACRPAAVHFPRHLQEHVFGPEDSSTAARNQKEKATKFLEALPTDSAPVELTPAAATDPVPASQRRRDGLASLTSERLLTLTYLYCRARTKAGDALFRHHLSPELIARFPALPAAMRGEVLTYFALRDEVRQQAMTRSSVPGWMTLNFVQYVQAGCIAPITHAQRGVLSRSVSWRNEAEASGMMQRAAQLLVGNIVPEYIQPRFMNTLNGTDNKRFGMIHECPDARAAGAKLQAMSNYELANFLATQVITFAPGGVTDPSRSTSLRRIVSLPLALAGIAELRARACCPEEHRADTAADVALEMLEAVVFVNTALAGSAEAQTGRQAKQGHITGTHVHKHKCRLVEPVQLTLAVKLHKLLPHLAGPLQMRACRVALQAIGYLGAPNFARQNRPYLDLCFASAGRLAHYVRAINEGAVALGREALFETANELRSVMAWMEAARVYVPELHAAYAAFFEQRLRSGASEYETMYPDVAAALSGIGLQCGAFFHEYAKHIPELAKAYPVKLRIKTLRAFCIVGVYHPPAINALWAPLVSTGLQSGEKTAATLKTIALALRVEAPELRLAPPAAMQKIMDAYEQPLKVSEAQELIHTVLHKALGLACECEVPLPGADGLDVDILLSNWKAYIECNGPFHYYVSQRPVSKAGVEAGFLDTGYPVRKGRDRFKARIAAKVGYRAVDIPAWCIRISSESGEGNEAAVQRVLAEYLLPVLRELDADEGP